MTTEQFNAKINELITQNPGVALAEIPGYQEALNAYTTGQISTAVQSEKSKLYGTIDEFKKKNLELSESNANLSTQVTDYTTKFQDLSKKVEAFTLNPITSDKYKDKDLTPQQMADLNNQQTQGMTQADVQSILDKKFTEELPKIIQASLKPVLDTTQNLQQETLSSYRDNRLRELGDSVIPELVAGNSKEEIEASIVSSKAVRDRFTTTQTPTTPPVTPPVTPPQVQTPQPQAPQGYQQPPQTVPPSTTTVTQTPPPSSILDSVKSMSMNDFGKNREALLKELAVAAQK